MTFSTAASTEGSSRILARFRWSGCALTALLLSACGDSRPADGLPPPAAAPERVALYERVSDSQGAADFLVAKVFSSNPSDYYLFASILVEREGLSDVLVRGMALRPMVGTSVATGPLGCEVAMPLKQLPPGMTPLARFEAWAAGGVTVWRSAIDRPTVK